MDGFIAEESAVLAQLSRQPAAAAESPIGAQGEPRPMQVEENLVWLDRDEMQSTLKATDVEYGYYEPEPFSFDTDEPLEEDFAVDEALQQQFEAASQQELQRVVAEEKKREDTRKRELLEYITDLKSAIAFNKACSDQYTTLAGHTLARFRHEKELMAALEQEEQALHVLLGKAVKVQRVVLALLQHGRDAGAVPNAVLARVPVVRKAYTDVASAEERPSATAVATATALLQNAIKGSDASERSLAEMKREFEVTQSQRLEQRQKRIATERAAEAEDRARAMQERQREFEKRERLLISKTERELLEKGVSVDEYVAALPQDPSQAHSPAIVAEDELWATFEEEDRRRTDVGPDDELEELMRQTQPEQSDGVRFLSEEESDAFIKATTRDPQAEEAAMAAFLADLEEANLPPEEDSGKGRSRKGPAAANPSVSSLTKGGTSGLRMLKSSALKISVGAQIATGKGELTDSVKLAVQEGVTKTPFPSGRQELLRIVVHTIELVEEGFSLEEVDPFVIIQVGPTRKKTCGLAKSQDGIWHDTFIFDEKEVAKLKEPGHVVFTVAKKATGKSKVPLKAELLGSSAVPLEQYGLDSPAYSQELSLFDKKGEAKAALTITLHRCTTLPIVPPQLAAVRPFAAPVCKQVLGIQELMAREERHDDSQEVIRANATKLTPLQLAAESRPPDLVAVEEILRAGEQPVPYQWTNYREETFLHLMTLHNQADLVRRMAPYTDLSLKERNGSTCLHVAAMMGHLKTALALIECGANVNELERYYKTSALALAAMQGHRQLVEVLLRAGAQKDSMDRFGSTPLMKACLFGHVEVVEVLIEAKALLNAEDVEGFSPLHLALLQGHMEIAMLLLASGARCLPTAEGISPLAMLFPTYRQVDTKTVFEKILARTDVNERYGRHRQSLLHIVLMSYSGDHCARRLRTLLKEDSTDVNVLNRMGQSPLFYAVHFGDLKIVQRLLKAGAKAEIKDKLGNTVLHYCSSRPVAEVLVMSLMAETHSTLPKSAVMQMYISGKNSQGNTPLHCAYAFGNAELVDYLHACSASATAKNMFGLTPAASIVSVRKRLLPFYSGDEEAPYHGCVVIGRIHCPSHVLDAWIGSCLRV